MEHRQRAGSEAENGGIRARLRGAHHRPSDVPGDSREVWESSSFGFQKRWPVDDSNLEPILPAVSCSCEKFSQGLFACFANRPASVEQKLHFSELQI